MLKEEESRSRLENRVITNSPQSAAVIVTVTSVTTNEGNTVAQLIKQILNPINYCHSYY